VRVQSKGGFVEHEDLRIGDECQSKREALPLSRREMLHEALPGKACRLQDEIYLSPPRRRRVIGSVNIQ
jgi:hypothetical protein